MPRTSAIEYSASQRKPVQRGAWHVIIYVQVTSQSVVSVIVNEQLRVTLQRHKMGSRVQYCVLSPWCWISLGVDSLCETVLHCIHGVFIMYVYI